MFRIPSSKAKKPKEITNSPQGGFLPQLSHYWGSSRLPAREDKSVTPLQFLKNKKDYKITAVVLNNSTEVCFLLSKEKEDSILYRYNWENQNLQELILSHERYLIPTAVSALSEEQIAVAYPNQIDIYNNNGRFLKSLCCSFKDSTSPLAIAFLEPDKLIIVQYSLIQIYEISTDKELYSFNVDFDNLVTEFPWSCDIRITVNDVNIFIAFFQRTFDIPADTTVIIKNFNSQPKLAFIYGVYLCETNNHLVVEKKYAKEIVDSCGHRGDFIRCYDICLLNKDTFKVVAKAGRNKIERSVAVCLPNGCIRVDAPSDSVLYSPTLERIGARYDETSNFEKYGLAMPYGGRPFSNAPFIFFGNEGIIAGNLRAHYQNLQILEDSLTCFSLDIVRLIKAYGQPSKFTYASSVPKETLIQFGSLLLTHLDDVSYFPLNHKLGCCFFTAPQLAAKRNFETQLRELLSNQKSITQLQLEETMTSLINNFWEAIRKSNKTYRDGLATFLDLTFLGSTQLDVVNSLKTFTVTHLHVLIANLIDKNKLSAAPYKTYS